MKTQKSKTGHKHNCAHCTGHCPGRLSPQIKGQTADDIAKSTVENLEKAFPPQPGPTFTAFLASARPHA